MRQRWIKNGLFWTGLLVLLGLLPFFISEFHLNLVITMVIAFGRVFLGVSVGIVLGRVYSFPV